MGVALTRDREDLYARINKRVQVMVEQGLVAEIAGLDDLSITSAKAIGVREIRAHLEGGGSLAEAVAAIQQATRRYAKRQITWMKRETGFQTICLPPDSTARFAADRILELFPCLHLPPPSVPSL